VLKVPLNPNQPTNPVEKYSYGSGTSLENLGNFFSYFVATLPKFTVSTFTVSRLLLKAIGQVIGCT